MAFLHLLAYSLVYDPDERLPWEKLVAHPLFHAKKLYTLKDIGVKLPKTPLYNILKMDLAHLVGRCVDKLENLDEEAANELRIREEEAKKEQRV